MEYQKSSGWISLAIFCTIRLIGAAAQLATINNPTDKTALTTALITSILGLSPLLVATSGIIARAYYSILDQGWSTLFSTAIVRGLQVLATMGLVLCIVGATNAANVEDIESEPTIHVGVILFTIIFAALVLLTASAILGKRMTSRSEGLLIAAVAVALPFLTVRVVFSLLSAFSHDSDFNPVTGSTTVELFMEVFMEVLEEMVVIIIYLLAGVKLAAVPKVEDGPQHSTRDTLASRTGRGNFFGLLSGTTLHRSNTGVAREAQSRLSAVCSCRRHGAGDEAAAIPVEARSRHTR